TCRKALVWGRTQEGLDKYQNEMESCGFKIQTTMDIQDIPKSCNLIVTCTPSKAPLLTGDQIQEGTHITAIGSDTPEKQELDPVILQKADRVIVDSVSQAQSRGECFHALKEEKIVKEDLIELGWMISNKEFHRASGQEITVADLTGVAIQDIQISKAVYEGSKQ
ncbi:MAG: ornithine cyclodeaminase family protein, partial [Candidatus Hodarchaeota archaeon]